MFCARHRELILCRPYEVIQCEGHELREQGQLASYADVNRPGLLSALHWLSSRR
jgi:hypothetical protein